MIQLEAKGTLAITPELMGSPFEYSMGGTLTRLEKLVEIPR
jgi:hypothetical protein